MHSEYAEGPLLPDVAQLAPVSTVRRLALHLVDGRVPLEARRRLAKVAMVASREIDAPAGFYGDILGSERLFVLSAAHRAVGMALTDAGEHFFRLGWRDAHSFALKQLDPPHLEAPRTKIARVWLAANYRHRGLALEMLRAIAAYDGLAVQDLGWELPFTDAGSALVRRICPDVVLGSAGDGHTMAIALGRQ